VPELIPYDEFGLFHENAAEYGIAYSGPPEVRRVEVEVSPGRNVSALVDITPGVNAEKAAPVTNFVNGPASFDSFDDILARTIEHNPGRSESSLRRGILHNAVQRDDGSWVWRYARFRPADGTASGPPDFGRWWDAISGLRVPLLLVRGLAWSVVDDADVDELVRRQPAAQVVGVEGAGHSIQGDRPLELAEILARFFSLGPV